MALDFHILGEKSKRLFGLDDTKLKHLEDVFQKFKQQTGIYIDPYGDLILSVESQKIIIQIINRWLTQEDLNLDKDKTKSILVFCGLLTYFSENQIDLELHGD
jgi:hypothetical protein